MGLYVLKRLLQLILVLFGISIAVFLILRVIPGDPAALMLPLDAPREQVEHLREILGLNEPLHVQYLTFLSDAVRGDLGDSFRWKIPASGLVFSRLPATLQLTVAAMLWAVVLSFIMGILAGAHQGSLVDRLVLALNSLIQATPSFWFGLVLIIIFALQWRLLPAMGRGGLEYILMPSFTLSLVLIPTLALTIRTNLHQILHEDFVRTARAKGLPEGKVLLKHAMAPLLISLITILGMQFGRLLGGAFIIEVVFAWPGIGDLTLQAIRARDYTVVQAVTLIVSGIFVLVNLLVDLSYAFIDPRVRLK
jgi:ABC-type dipeptide/oligopeptide/nickel transport system permease component